MVECIHQDQTFKKECDQTFPDGKNVAERCKEVYGDREIARLPEFGRFVAQACKDCKANVMSKIQPGMRSFEDDDLGLGL